MGPRGDEDQVTQLFLMIKCLSAARWRFFRLLINDLRRFFGFDMKNSFRFDPFFNVRILSPPLNFFPPSPPPPPPADE